MPNVTPLRAEDPDRVGRYRLSGRISGMPGTGPVFLAGAVSGPEVVVRLLRGGWTRDPAERDRFAAEASPVALPMARASSSRPGKGPSSDTASSSDRPATYSLTRNA